MKTTMKDAWNSGDPYEYYMGRWSRLVAESFVDWLCPPPGMSWLDVGCGSGALSQIIASNHQPEMLIAIDQSENFVRTAQKRLGRLAHSIVGKAQLLPLDESLVDIAVSGLVLNFISEPEKALSEMMRITCDGGTVALYIWDYAGKMEFLSYFWDAAVKIKPSAMNLHESRRFQDSNAKSLRRLFEGAGFVNIKTTSIEITTLFRDFDDYWEPFLGGQGPAPSFVMSLDEGEKNNLRNILKVHLPTELDGSISMVAHAWAIKGQTTK